MLNQADSPVEPVVAKRLFPHAELRAALRIAGRATRQFQFGRKNDPGPGEAPSGAQRGTGCGEAVWRSKEPDDRSLRLGNNESAIYVPTGG